MYQRKRHTDQKKKTHKKKTEKKGEISEYPSKFPCHLIWDWLINIHSISKTFQSEMHNLGFNNSPMHLSASSRHVVIADVIVSLVMKSHHA